MYGAQGPGGPPLSSGARPSATGSPYSITRPAASTHTHCPCNNVPARRSARPFGYCTVPRMAGRSSSSSTARRPPYGPSAQQKTQSGPSRPTTSATHLRTVAAHAPRQQPQARLRIASRTRAPGSPTQATPRVPPPSPARDGAKTPPAPARPGRSHTAQGRQRAP